MVRLVILLDLECSVVPAHDLQGSANSSPTSLDGDCGSLHVRLLAFTLGVLVDFLDVIGSTVIEYPQEQSTENHVVQDNRKDE